MLLLLHISIALSSLVFASVMFAKPSKRKVGASYVLAGATLASGTALVTTTGASILHACIMGLIYLAVVLTLTVFAQRKLATNI